jgi:hypothetical protein
LAELELATREEKLKAAEKASHVYPQYISVITRLLDQKCYGSVNYLKFTQTNGSEARNFQVLLNVDEGSLEWYQFTARAEMML